MKNILFALSVCLLTGTLWSQKAPGYQGRRLSIVYDLNVHPRLDVWTNMINPGPNPVVDKDPLFEISHSIGLDYVINRRASFGLSYQFFPFSASQTNDQMYSYSGSAQMVGINFKRFRMRSNAIAPFGKYIKPELILLFYSGTYQNVTAQNTGYGYGPPKVTNGNFSSGPRVGLAFSMGRNYIVFKRMIIDRGIRVSLLNMLNAVNSNSNSATVDPAVRKIIFNQWINFYFGIGLLP
jgi:hypothetical protein